eukprot:g61303.t1
MLLCGGAKGMLRIFDVGGMTSAPLMTWQAHQTGITRVAFSSDFSSIYSAAEDSTVIQWSLYKTGTILKSFRLPAGPPGRCCFGSDHFWFYGTTGGEVYAYNEDIALPVQKLTRHGTAITAMDKHPSMDLLLTGSADHTLSF